MSDLINDMKNRFEAEQAIILYKNRRVNYNYYPYYEYYVALHGVFNGEIAEGRPITKEALIDIVSKFTPLLKDEVSYIPPEVIFYSHMNEFVVWTSPPQIRTLFFHKNTGIKTGKAPVPATLFAVKKKGLYVWALKENSRPILDTPLFHTPFYNVYPHGTCLGNMTVPKRDGIQTIKEWERLFFESAFTSGANPVLKGISGKELWASLIRSDKKDFPVKYLKPFHKKTVKDIPEILERRIR